MKINLMKRMHPSARIGFTLLTLILLLLPVYGYACVLPMLGAPSDDHNMGCPFIDCGVGKAHGTGQKYCESLQKVHVQSALSLQDVLAKTPIAPLFSQLSILPEVSKARWTLSPSEKSSFPASPEIYILHRSLLL
ncbi:MAG: hypothetical protein L0Y56_09815 [Nitrospira sp.]|nr:hypothetical protein [Nitrospira sp.]